jgi:endo-1,3(4)-beta-glucanase
MCSVERFLSSKFYFIFPILADPNSLQNFTPAGTINNGYTEKYKATLEDGTIWLIYRTHANGTPPTGPLTLNTNFNVQGHPNFHGYIQVAKLSDPSFETVYDSSSGAYAVSGTITAITTGTDGRYSFNWTKEGLPKPVLMFALPHHVESFASETAACITPIRMRAITKGTMSGVLSDYWVLLEQLPAALTFAPYSLQHGSVTALSDSVKSFINKIAAQEIQQDVIGQCCLNSMYFSGQLIKSHIFLVSDHFSNALVQGKDWPSSP